MSFYLCIIFWTRPTPVDVCQKMHSCFSWSSFVLDWTTIWYTTGSMNGAQHAGAHVSRIAMSSLWVLTAQSESHWGHKQFNGSYQCKCTVMQCNGKWVSATRWIKNYAYTVSQGICKYIQVLKYASHVRKIKHQVNEAECIRKDDGTLNPGFVSN